MMTTANETLLRIENLSTDFTSENGQLRAVDAVSFTVEAKEIVGVLGESGCGKSVTAESIMRLHDARSTHYEGKVIFRGMDLLTVSEADMRQQRGGGLGMIFQDPMNSLNPVLSIGNQLVEAIRTHSKSTKSEAKTRATELLRLTGIPSPEARMKDYPHQLSGGMKQRVMIAMALSSNPEILIADEPTTALDVTTQAQILELIEEQRDRFGIGIILITHDLGVVAEVCDRVVVMYLGQVIEEASVTELFDNPRHPYTKGLLKSTPSMDADPGDDLPVIPGRVPTLNAIPPGCRFADRCSWAIGKCREASIPLVEIGTGHTARCIRLDEIEE